MEKVYYVKAYTDEWKHRRWCFTNRKQAVDYILSEFNQPDVQECWLECWKLRKGGGLELEECYPYQRPF